MKINFDLKSKYPNVEFCYNNKCIIIRYWGGLKFDKVVFYDSEQINSYSEEEVLNFTQTMIMQYKFGNTNIEQMDLLKETLEQFKNK